MKKFVSFRSCIETLSVSIAMLVLSILLVVGTRTSYRDEVSGSSSSATVPNGTHLNVSDYWTEDRPYMYAPHWRRLPDGEIVPNNDSSFSSFAEYRGAVETRTPWISKWVLSTEGRHTLKKDVPRLLMYNLVSPMDYGGSLRSSNVRRRRNKAVRMFLTDNLALPLLKSLGRVAWNLIQSHYVGYFENEIFAQRLEIMNASEMIREFNLTLPIDESEAAEEEESRPNSTQAFTYDGESKRAQLYARFSASFAPYKGYSDQYYTRDDNLPPPTLPADSYPWLWSPRLNMTRIIVSQLLQSLGVDDEKTEVVDGNSSAGNGDAELGSCSSNCVDAESDEFPRELANLANESSNSVLNVSTPANGNIATGVVNGSHHSSRIAMSSKDIQALEQIQVQLQEFYCDTGTPRLAIHSNVSHSAFPSLAEFLRASLTSDAHANLSTASESSTIGSPSGSNDAGTFRASSLNNISGGDEDNIGNATDFSTRSGVYAALTHYYAYPSVDKWEIESFGEENVADCTVERVCLVQSGVTVYTPSLTTLKLFQTFADTSVDPSTKRTMRLKALLEMVQVAFEAERRALKHGLRGPSTVWYSNHDLDVDEFADAVLGTVNMSISGDAGDSTPLHVFEKHMNEQVPILDEMVSYYADTNHDTKISMELNRSIPMLDKFEESELVELVSLLESQMKILDRSIVSYVQTRAANPLYQEVVNATIRGDFYNGSEYTLVGFGFIIPATNNLNVLYRDMKLPVPFHLVLRLIVRFQESRLLLPEESRQLVVCLAMAFYNISFYHCRPTSSSDDE